MSYEDWREAQRKNTVLYSNMYDILLGNVAADVFGVQSQVMDLWYDQNCMGLLLTGEDGCGKHTAAAYFLRSVLQHSPNCACLFLDGEDYAEQAIDGKTLNAYISSYLDDCYDGVLYDEGSGRWIKTGEAYARDSCIVIDQPLRIKAWKTVLKFLQKTTVEYYHNSGYPRLFIVLLSTEPFSLPLMMQNTFRRCHFARPKLSQRKALCESLPGAAQIKAFLSIDRITELSEGMTCAELKNAFVNLQCIADQLDAEMLEEFLTTQVPPLTAEQQRADFEAGLLILLEKMIEQMKHMPTGDAVTVVSAEAASQIRTEPEQPALLNEAQEEEKAAKNRKAELEKMDNRQLFIEVLGQERVEQLNVACSHARN